MFTEHGSAVHFLYISEVPRFSFSEYFRGSDFDFLNISEFQIFTLFFVHFRGPDFHFLNISEVRIFTSLPVQLFSQVFSPTLLFGSNNKATDVSTTTRGADWATGEQY